jgi:hypothetical protein
MLKIYWGKFLIQIPRKDIELMTFVNIDGGNWQPHKKVIHMV